MKRLPDWKGLAGLKRPGRTRCLAMETGSTRKRTVRSDSSSRFLWGIDELGWSGFWEVVTYAPPDGSLSVNC